MAKVTELTDEELDTELAVLDAPVETPPVISQSVSELSDMGLDTELRRLGAPIEPEPPVQTQAAARVQAIREPPVPLQ